MKSLANLPRGEKPPEESVDSAGSTETTFDSSLVLLAFLLSRMGDQNPEILNSMKNAPGGEKLRLALKLGSELKRCGDGFSSLKVVSRYTKQNMGQMENVMARSEQLRKTVEMMRTGGAGGMEALIGMAGINPALASMLKGGVGGGISPEMLMGMLGRR